MKKLTLLAATALLTACSNSSTSNASLEGVQLNTPQKTEVGFVRLSPKSQYYVDTSSVWVDSEKSHLINFDTVINLHIGHRVFEDKLLTTRSIRQHKVLNCENQTMTHTGSHLYADFWGEGVALTPKTQREHRVKLRPRSSLGTIGQIMCTNFYHQS
ncbi:hypothetical protein A4G18_02650 [Pasteurellaceae bacterium Pebbles2]|nr:hypothetical protein [Pasteurellaceae bacterium Pebbles2]